MPAPKRVSGLEFVGEGVVDPTEPHPEPVVSCGLQSVPGADHSVFPFLRSPKIWYREEYGKKTWRDNIVGQHGRASDDGRLCL